MEMMKKAMMGKTSLNGDSPSKSYDKSSISPSKIALDVKDGMHG